MELTMLEQELMQAVKREQQIDDEVESLIALEAGLRETRDWSGFELEELSVESLRRMEEMLVGCVGESGVNDLLYSVESMGSPLLGE